MRYLILSDIHANREALEAVLAHSSGRYDEIVYCGDLVGYGADPEWAVEWARATLRLVIRGNHDKACAGIDDLEWFNPAARASAEWTRGVLSERSLNYLISLPAGPMPLGPAEVVHGSPLDEDEYVLQMRDALQLAPYLDSQLTFFGHTHVQGGFLLRPNASMRIMPQVNDEPSGIDLDADSFYMINPGSVGQPRDGDPRAAYAVYEPERRSVEYYRVNYDIAGAQEKIRKAGLPKILADRLATGN